MKSQVILSLISKWLV